eukprot:1069036-Lingulodinium_polyedra.AAC.1
MGTIAGLLSVGAVGCQPFGLFGLFGCARRERVIDNLTKSLRLPPPPFSRRGIVRPRRILVPIGIL